jgi:hypothetical protein
MEDMNWKTWAIIFIIAMGAGLEAIKRMPGTNRLDTEPGIPGVTPYAVKLKGAPMAIMGDAPRALPAPKQVAIGGQTISKETLEKFIAANKPEQTDFDKVFKGMADKNAAAAKKKKDKDGEEYEIIVDPKTGKRYKRKKKKGAKAEPEKKEEVAKVEKKPEHKEDIKVEDLMAQTIATGQLPPPPNKADTPFADLEEWKRRLLTQPDAAETRTFIDHYKNNIVAADIFYKITQMMIEDSRPEMKELGILCAGSTPSSMSFSMLAQVHNTERSGSRPRTYADGFLNQYANAGNLNILKQVMQGGGNPQTTILATQKVDTAAQALLNPKLNKAKAPTTDPNNTQQTSVVAHSNSVYFKPFLPVLQSLAKDKDASVVAQAKSTLADIQRLMYPNANPNPPATTQFQASAER